PCSSSSAASNDASDKPPALPRSLWHPAQYCLTSAVCSAGSMVVVAGACETAGLTGAFTAGLVTWAETATPTRAVMNTALTKIFFSM
ncbi:MAG: hypothetical protein Q8N52_01800, partial [Acidobacteriota bacterium]|nr:hypothetical protein [Acidobacteriota bacterium]